MPISLATAGEALSHVEPSTWQVTPDGKLAPTQQVGLRSLESRSSVSLHFVNNADVAAEIIWLTYCGEEKIYLVLEPGSMTIMRTFKTHPWIARVARADGASPGPRLMLGNRMVAFGEIDGECFTISRPPPLQWSLQTHKHFPAPFRKLIKALILSHHARAPEPGTADPAAAAAPSTARSTRAKSKNHSTVYRAVSCLFALFSSCMVYSGGAQPCRLGPGSDALLRALPLDLLLHIVSFMAPPQRQCVTLHPDGHPSIEPALLPCSPPSLAAPCPACRQVHGP